MGTSIITESGTLITTEGGFVITTDGRELPINVTTPPAPTWSASEFAINFQDLLPTGAVWPRDPDAIQTAVMAALVPTYVRNTQAAAALIVDVFPPTTGESLPEWESSLGLPDPCAGEAPTTQGRVAQVVARFTAGGGQSVPYFVGYLANLGFSATVTQFTPMRCGMSCNQPAYDDDWAFAWKVEIGTSATTPGAVAACELERMQPAHTYVVTTVAGTVIYGSGGPPILPGIFLLDDSDLDGPDFLA